jgi:hypothetical protein
LRRRITGLQLDECAAEEIARRGYPGTALPAPAGPLFERDQPAAFNGVRVG